MTDISGNIGKKPIYRRNFAEKTDKKPKFPMADNRKEISCRHSPIHEISAKYRPIFPIFQTLFKIENKNKLKICKIEFLVVLGH